MYVQDLESERNTLLAQVEGSRNETSNKNLTLGRILMAVDNLYDRCNEGAVHKIRAPNIEEVREKIRME